MLRRAPATPGAAAHHAPCTRARTCSHGRELQAVPDGQRLRAGVPPRQQAVIGVLEHHPLVLVEGSHGTTQNLGDGGSGGTGGAARHRVASGGTEGWRHPCAGVHAVAQGPHSLLHGCAAAAKAVPDALAPQLLTEHRRGRAHLRSTHANMHTALGGGCQGCSCNLSTDHCAVWLMPLSTHGLLHTAGRAQLPACAASLLLMVHPPTACRMAFQRKKHTTKGERTTNGKTAPPPSQPVSGMGHILCPSAQTQHSQAPYDLPRSS